MEAPARRNDPCPCGSGLRFKECHGKLDAGVGADRLMRDALAAHQQGRIDDAERDYRKLIEADPRHAVATHYLGMIAWQRGDPEGGEKLMRESLALDASVPDFHSNLALLVGQSGRHAEAIEGFRRALAVNPDWYEAANNLGLALEDTAQWDAAEAAYREALARAPQFAQAHQNLGRLLLLEGRFAEAWPEYRWRLAARGMAPAPDPHAQPLGAALAGRRFALRGEQGIGDVLFFLRFAPELVSRGAQLAFRGDTRLHAMLSRTGLFALGCGDDAQDAHGLETVFVGDLPWLLAANHASALPRALALAPLPERVADCRARLQQAGPRPWIALAWRAGVQDDGAIRTFVKDFPIAEFGAALRGVEATWISVQRRPEPGAREGLQAAIGAHVHDFSAANEDLEDMLALLSLVDASIGPSNTNTHLLVGLGNVQQVLVPNPPEWRWLHEGAESPWFRGSPILRPDSAGGWASAYALLRR